jgi:hypothetical protein
MAVAGYNRSIPEILTDLIAQFTTLVRKEGQLARAEVSENVGRVAAGIGLVIGGAVLLIPALVILFQMAVIAIADLYGVAPFLSALIVGGAALVLGLLLLIVGLTRFRARQLVPDRTIGQLQHDAAMARAQFNARNDHDLHKAA